MDTVLSTTTLLPPAEVAKRVGIAVPTMYAWIQAGMVRNTFDVLGRPVFTREEVEMVRALAERRRAATDSLRVKVEA